MGDTNDENIDPIGSIEQNEPAVDVTSPKFSFDTSFATEDVSEEGGINTSLLNTTVEPPKRPEESHIVPVFVFTAIFGLIFIIAPLFVRRGPNRSITRVCIMLSTVCCWIFWTTTYIVQMNPLLGPRMSNHSLAWVGHKWGHDAASLTAASMNDTEKTTEAMFNETDATTPASMAVNDPDPGPMALNEPDTGATGAADPDAEAAVGSSDPNTK